MNHWDQSETRAMRILQVGCGGMSAIWLKTAAEMDGVEVVGLVDLQEAAALARRDEFAPEAAISSDFESHFNELKPDVVFNCTIPGAHHAISTAAMRGGAHVLSEKPLAATLDEAADLVKTAEETGRVLAVMQNRRHTRAIREVQRVIASGALGTITEVSCDFQLGAHFGGFREEMEHVLLLDMAVHHFDMARFITGLDAQDVWCHEWNPVGSWFRHGACAHAHFGMSDDCVFSYRGSWVAEGAHTSWGGAWRVTGTKGTIVWDGEERGEEGSIRIGLMAGADGLIRASEHKSEAAPPAEGFESGHKSLIEDFIINVRSGVEPNTVARDNIRSLAMVAAAIESAASQSACSVAGG